MGKLEEFQKDIRFQKTPENVHGLTARMHYRQSDEEVDSSATLSDLIDIAQIQKLAESHYRAAGMPIGIIDAKSGAILVGVGWQDICVHFHRAHPDSARWCTESDRSITNHILNGMPHAYKCKNGLWDIGIPILVEGQHLATLFLGQFLYEGESPDRDFFIGQARTFGYDLSAYLAALDRIPVFSRKTVNNILNYNVAFANFIADLADKKKCLRRELDERKRAEEALHERERKFRAIFDQTFHFIGLVNIDGRLIEANRTAMQFSGVRELDAIGKLFWETPWWTHSAELQDRLRAAVEKAVAGECVRFEAIHPSVDGSLHCVDFSIKPVMNEAGGVALLIAEGRDITDRKQAEEALLKASRVIHALWECNNALIHVKDESQLLQEVCRIIVEVGGYRMAWVGYAGHDANRTVTPVARYGNDDGYLENIDVTWKDTERGRGPVGTSIRVGAPSVVRDVEKQSNFAPWREEAVKRGYVSVIGLPLFVEGCVLGCLAIYAAESDAFDVDEVNLLSRLAVNLSFGITTLRTSQARKQAEMDLKRAHDELEKRVRERTSELAAANEQLRNSEAQLRFLSSRLLHSQEEERKRIAREIHDSLGSSLSAVKISLESARTQLQEREPIATSLDTPISWTQLAIDEARRLMTDLRPSILDDLGLLATIEWFLRQHRTLHPSLCIEEELDVEERDIPEPLKIVVFRIMQEAFHNISKYSQAELVSLSLVKTDDAIELFIEDNGEGFDVQAALCAKTVRRGLGLASMKERAELSGGSFAISSVLGEGTTIRASWTSDGKEPLQSKGHVCVFR